MINNSLKTIILAAGESKRILSSQSKILHTVGGKTILRHVLDNVGKIIRKKNINIVISPKLNKLKNEYKKINFSFHSFFKNSKIFLFLILYFSKILIAFLKVVGSGQQGPDAISVILFPVTSEIIKEIIFAFVYIGTLPP